MTLEVYSHVRDGALRAAVERIRLPYAERADGKRMDMQRSAAKLLLTAKDQINPRRWTSARYWIRTSGLRLRRPTLYPSELIARGFRM